MPSDAQLSYARTLIKACGYDEQLDYPNLEKMSGSEMHELITALKEELGWS